MNRQKHSHWPIALLIALAALALTMTPAWACGGGVICVDKDATGANNGTSWANAYTTLQAALDQTNADGGAAYEIWVAEGVYYPDEGPGHINNAITETFLIARNNVQLYGGFAGNETARSQRDWVLRTTILSGDIDGNDWNTDTNHINETWRDTQGKNAQVLYLDGVTNESITGATVLDGFTITAGRIEQGANRNADGGGLYCGGRNGHLCNPTLVNITFSGNWTYYGGGMCNDGAYSGESSPTLTHVVFSGNRGSTQGGGMLNRGHDSGVSSPVLTDVTFNDNYGGDGGGMYNMGIAGVSNPILNDVSFKGNSALNYGGGMTNDGSYGVSSPIINNAVFSGNWAGYGGGGIHNLAQNGASNPILINVTIGGNSTAGDGGGMHNAAPASVECSPILVNCILWGNTATNGPQIYNYSNASPNITYSNIQWLSGVYTGTGNINADPQFVAPISATAAPTTTGNYRLTGFSPAIDAGNNYSVSVATDLDGAPRKVDMITADTGNGVAPIVDMGAYEAHNNTAPTLAIPDVAMSFDTTRALELWNYAADIEDTDANLTFLVVSVSDGHLVATLAGDGHTLNLEPETAWTGSATVNISVTDSRGLAANDSFVVTVSGNANTAPTLNIPDISMPFDTTRALELRDYANDAQDLDANLTFSVVSVSDGHLVATLAGDGHTLNLEPETAWTGSATVTVRVTDSGGLTANDSFVVIVTGGGGNTPPTLSIPTVPLDINEVGTLNLWDYASDAEDADATLVFTVESVSTVSLTVTLSGGHILNLTPATDWSGAATVAVSVKDSGALSASDTFNVNVGVMNFLYLPLVLRNWPPLPAAPILQAIVNDDADGAYTVQWAAADRAASYELQEANNAAFSGATQVYSGTATAWNASGKTTGAYYYRVRGRNTYGAGPWSSTQAAQVTPPPVLDAIADTYIAQGDPADAFHGSDSIMRIGYEPAVGNLRGLVKFDLSTIPTNTPIVNATIQMYYIKYQGTPAYAQTVTAHHIVSPQDWSDTDAISWDSVVVGDAYGTISLKPSLNPYGYYTIDITNLVQGWINGTIPNHGILLRGPENTVESCRTFTTKDFNVEPNRNPKLLITYQGVSQQIMMTAPAHQRPLETRQ